MKEKIFFSILGLMATTIFVILNKTGLNLFSSVLIGFTVAFVVLLIVVIITKINKNKKA
ncbi:hypothetical protein [Clostridium polynesiense]|uniref:hypothetical protein n=1 Tax=Clostridium polynesiense TaxID=1325933 RepID=UPI000AD27729|nr:hypothetical protein [Clostridium polynesiense]